MILRQRNNKDSQLRRPWMFSSHLRYPAMHRQLSGSHFARSQTMDSWAAFHYIQRNRTMDSWTAFHYIQRAIKQGMEVQKEYSPGQSHAL